MCYIIVACWEKRRQGYLDTQNSLINLYQVSKSYFYSCNRRKEKSAIQIWNILTVEFFLILTNIKTNICKNEDYPINTILNFRHIGNHWRSTRQRQKCNKISWNNISYEWRMSSSKVQWKETRMCTDSSNGPGIIFALLAISGKITILV